MKEKHNGMKERVLRRYDSLRRFIGENRIYPKGDVLCVSSRNNEDFDVELTADGKSRFLELWRRRKSSIDDIEQVSQFLSGFSGKYTLLEILRRLIDVSVEEGEEGDRLVVTVDPLEDI